VRLISVGLAVVVQEQPEPMGKDQPRQVAQDFPMTRFSMLAAAVVAEQIRLHLLAEVVALVVTVATVTQVRKLVATVLHLAAAVAVAREVTALDLARRVVTVLMA
jgi:hypothetical protein